MSDQQTIEWLRGLASKGGRGVVNNIDARCLGRIATEIEDLQFELKAARNQIEIADGEIARLTAPQPATVAQRPLAYRLDHPAMGIELSICEPDKDWVARGWIVTPLYASPAQSSWQPITDKMVKAGAAAMCCQAQTLGCAAKNKDSEFTTCMLPTFLEDARRCLSAALSSTEGK